MVTSNKLPDKKVFKMSEQNSNTVVPQRTLLEEVNAHLTCYLCRGYYIDATTIVECLHSFCRSCIIKHLQVKSYCPVCEMMINSAKPNIKPDKALQDIVYKLVPGLFQKEMERRQQFYASRPGPAASATPEQRGEDTERIIFSPEDVISFSLEYADVTDADSISSKSSDSNEQQQPTAVTRRFLQCPAVVNISHLKKFLSMKFDIDSTQFSIDILYKRVPLPDYYTLMDIAYIYNWKRNEPMRFFYQIIDYIAIRSRYGLFDINRKGSHFRDRKSSPTPTEDTNASSPAPHLQDHGSEPSSGTDSPMPDDSSVKKCNNSNKNQTSSDNTGNDVCVSPSHKNCDEDVEKSQFLNSFELTAKNSSSVKSPNKTQSTNDNETGNLNEQCNKDLSKTGPNKSPGATSKVDEPIMKRKQEAPSNSPDAKKMKWDVDKSNLSTAVLKTPSADSIKSSAHNTKAFENVAKPKEIDVSKKDQSVLSLSSSNNPSQVPKDGKCNQNLSKPQTGEHHTSFKRPVPGTQLLSPPKRKVQPESTMPAPTQIPERKTISPLKIQLPKSDAQISKQIESPKSAVKKMPELKLGVPSSSLMNQNKTPVVNKVRMDLLANNCDPTMDRSKILSHVKTTFPSQGPGKVSGDPLKSLFDSCKINIPSSLSITLTEHKLDPRSEQTLPEPKNPFINRNNAFGGANYSNMHRHPTPPLHNFIEILKLPDFDPKKVQNKPDNHTQVNPIKKPDMTAPPKTNTTSKSTETSSSKGPVPSLKPIGETKLGKQGGLYPITSPYQQKYIQSLEQSEKSKLPKSKLQVPKLMPATPKTLNAANKDGVANNKNMSVSVPVQENKNPTKSDNVLDLSTSHNVQSQLGPQQTKTLETMQSIANLAKKQSLSAKPTPINITQNSPFSSMSNRSLTSEVSPLRIPNTNQIKTDKVSMLNCTQTSGSRPDATKSNPVRQLNTSSPNSTAQNYQATGPPVQNSPSTIPSPRPQTRSPSSSPKLVIAEDKTNSSESNVNQSNQISSTQICNSNTSKIDPPKVTPGPSKHPVKSIKPVSNVGKLTGIRQPITPTPKPVPTLNTPTDILLQPQMLPQAFLRHHMEWFKSQQARQYENILKNMTTAVQQNQKDFNKDDKQ